MLKRNFLAAILLLATLLLPVASRAEPLYTLTYLPELNFFPKGMNNTGQIVGVLGRGHGFLATFVYENGVSTDLGTFGYRHSSGAAINDAGVIAGSIWLASGEEHAYVYQNGNLTDLGAGAAHGINARGDVVGRKSTADGSTGFLYRDGNLTTLANLGTGTQGFATGINDHGTITGESTIDGANDAVRHPYVLEQGTMTDLGAPANGNLNGAVVINNAGQVAGYSTDPDGLRHAFLYQHGVMTNLGGFGSTVLDVNDINAHGTLVGLAYAQDQRIGFISAGNTLVDLNTLIDPALGWHIEEAYATNDLGQIVTYACRDGNTMCGIVRLDLASAVPEPGMALLLLPGLLAVARARQRPLRGNRLATPI
jgi:probable HAF family extracellular repeat protein